ncbi:MAG: hypothetical protein MK086_13145 [Flavobacteriales bacterium]|nr:hypothetical protein [Flavobacteriales bacterium]
MHRSLIIVIVSLFVHLQGSSQTDGLVSLLISDLDVYNLKGKVKSIKVNIDRLYPDTTPEEKRAEFEFWNFYDNRYFPVGYCEFDLDGYLTYHDKRADSLDYGFGRIAAQNKRKVKFIYEGVETQNKSQFYGKYSYDFPVYNPYAVYKNRKRKETGALKHRSAVADLYEYKVDEESGSITEEIYSHSDYSRKYTYRYEYNDKQQIIRQEFKFTEGAYGSGSYGAHIYPRTGLWSRNIIDAVLLGEVYYSYQYDELDRLEAFSIHIADDKMYEEKYFYEPGKNKPTKLGRYVKILALNVEDVTNYKNEWFNDFGDPVKCQFYESGFDTEPYSTQYYEYLYDTHQNWVQCNMYLEGGEEKTEQPTMVYRRNIIYYEN